MDTKPLLNYATVSYYDMVRMAEDILQTIVADRNYKVVCDEKKQYNRLHTMRRPTGSLPIYEGVVTPILLVSYPLHE